MFQACNKCCSLGGWNALVLFLLCVGCVRFVGDGRVCWLCLVSEWNVGHNGQGCV